MTGPIGSIDRRTLVVHDIDQARLALAAAREIGVPVRLWSAPGAAGTLGPEVFLAMVAKACENVPGIDVEAVLDCGDDPGFALAALCAGVGAVVVNARADVLVRLRDVAAQLAAVVFSERPSAYDLRAAADAGVAARKWLSTAQK